MAEISVTALAMVDAPPEQGHTALAYYREVRPAILTSNFSGYQVVEGGRGAGSQVRWTLNPARWGKVRRIYGEVLTALRKQFVPDAAAPELTDSPEPRDSPEPLA